LGALVLQSQPLANPDDEKLTQALLTYVAKKGLSVLNWGDKATALQVRVQCAKEWLPQTIWPNFSSTGLLNALDEWLAPFMLGIKNSRGLKSIDVLEALNAYLGWDKKTQLDQLLPNRLSLPSGNSAEIHYQLHKAPTVSVKLQEMFGEPMSPTVANGTQTIVLELLSPARRPLQITSDLAGFWRGAYKEVQKEMKGRYPKHPWPDNPEQHIATSKTKRQLKL
jgi:ATP-dependent helicase HrpB